MTAHLGKVKDRRGVALVVVLVVLVVLGAMVTEFAHMVYVETESLDNWRRRARMHLAARSALNLSAKVLDDNLKLRKFTYPGEMTIPVPGISEDLSVSLRIEDENSKFNINKIVFINGKINEQRRDGFLRLFEVLELDEDAALAVVDWLDADDRSELGGSEPAGARNGPMSTVEELRLVPGITSGIYDKVSSYVTVYGDGQININGASRPVLMSLCDKEAGCIEGDLADRIVEYRDLTPFSSPGELGKVAGMETLAIALVDRVAVKATAARAEARVRSQDGLRAAILTVVDADGTVKYWKEY